MSVHDSRVDALARVLIMESGVVHKQTYWVCGPPGPALRGDHDLSSHLLRLARQARSAPWTLSDYLRGLWKVSVPLRGHVELELDDVAAMFSAAVAAAPPPYDPRWSVTDLALPGRTPDGHPGWERVIKSQIADLEDFARHPQGSRGRFGIDAPRPPGGGTRATPARWDSLDPAGYLERALTGLRGPDDAHRPPPSSTAASPPSGPPPATESSANPLTWADLAYIALNGQTQDRPERANEPWTHGCPGPS